MSKPFKNEDAARLKKIAKAVVESFVDNHITDKPSQDASIRTVAAMTGIPLDKLKEAINGYLRRNDAVRK